MEMDSVESRENEKMQQKNITSSGDRTQASAIPASLLVPVSANSPFLCKFKTFRSLYSHTLLTLSKSSKSKNQVV